MLFSEALDESAQQWNSNGFGFGFGFGIGIGIGVHAATLGVQLSGSLSPSLR